MQAKAKSVARRDPKGASARVSDLSARKSGAADEFLTRAAPVVRRIREGFAAVVESVCGGQPRAHEIADGFGVHRKLGWQIWNVAYLDEPLAAIRHMPSGRGMQTWRDAAKKCGVAGELLGRLDECSALLERLIEEHSLDRDLLEIILDSYETRGDGRADLRWRKMAFTGNTYVWGVRVKTFLSATFLHPSQRRGYFDMVNVRGLIDLVRTRPNVRWPIAQAVVYSADDERHPAREPLAPSQVVRAGGVPLIEAFCSHPTPPVERRRGDVGMLEDELLPGPVGQSGALTIFTGEIVREVAPAYRTREGEDAMFAAGVRIPNETLISDHFVHRELFGDVERELRVYSELASPMAQDDRDRLPVAERLQSLGQGTARVRTAEVPNYMDLVNLVFERTGWGPAAFDVFRARMRYAPIPISVMVRHELPEQPAGVDD